MAATYAGITRVNRLFSAAGTLPSCVIVNRAVAVSRPSPTDAVRIDWRRGPCRQRASVDRSPSTTRDEDRRWTGSARRRTGAQ